MIKIQLILYLHIQFKLLLNHLYSINKFSNNFILRKLHYYFLNNYPNSKLIKFFKRNY